MNHWAFEYYEWEYLTFIKKCLTTDWPRIQTGTDEADLALWQKICVVLELDRKAMVDLMLLAHSGEPGRAEANEIMWTILSDLALDGEYEELSPSVSSLVGDARKNLDRPPVGHKDLKFWYWDKYVEPRNKDFAPTQVPPNAYVDCIEDEVPVPPPVCFKTDQ